MKTASGPLATLINSGAFDAYECYTIALVGGGSVLLTSAPFAIKSGATVWPANGPLVTEGSSQRAHWKVGTDVDSWVISIAPRAIDPITGAAFPDLIGSQPFLAGCRAGLLDGADVTIQRAYFDPATFVYPPPLAGATAVGFLTIFRGLIGDVDLTTSEAVLTVNDYRQLLTVQMPRNIYQAGCELTLYGAGCKLIAANFAHNGVVTASTSRSAFSTSATTTPSGSGTYALGRVKFTSGQNAGLTRMIKSWDGAHAITVAPPFPFNIANGDAATLNPGCDKTMPTCTAFGNLVNYGGNPFIPPPTTTT